MSSERLSLSPPNVPLCPAPSLPAHPLPLPDGGTFFSHNRRDGPGSGPSRADGRLSSQSRHVTPGMDVGARELGGMDEVSSRPGELVNTVSDDKAIEEDQEALYEMLVRRTEALRNGPLPTSRYSLDESGTDANEKGSEERRLDSDLDHFNASVGEREIRSINGLTFLQTLATSCIDQLAAVIEEDTREYLSSHDGNNSTVGNDSSEDESGDEGGRLRMALSLKNRKTGVMQIYSYPDNPELESDRQGHLHKISCILRVASVMMEALLEKTVITLSVVDKIADDIVATAELHRADFYICASAKGLMAATDLIIHRKTGEDLRLSPRHPTLIEPVERIEQLFASQGLDWLLIVEKDAVFQSLLSAGLLEDQRLGPGVLITGKGFPDLSTRQLVRLLADTFPDARFFGLFDADPHGVSILSNYVNGSRTNSHSTEHEGLGLGEKLEWIGLKASEWKSLGIDYNDLLPFEVSDDNLAASMLRDQERLPAEWKAELCHMLHLRCKAETEIIIGAQQQPDDQQRMSDDDQEDEDVMNVDEGQSFGVAKLVDWIVGKIKTL
ncbi:hypothetical protein IAR50_007126 [Cryptococcus sp. DSM 104548]